MGTVNIRPRIHRISDIPTTGLQIGSRGDRWEEEFIKNIDFSTMDNPTNMSDLFSNSKVYNFDLSDLDTSNVTNMDYMFRNVNAGTLNLNGLVVGANTSASHMFSGTFDSVNFTGATFYRMPSSMFYGATIRQPLMLNTLDTSNITSLAYMFDHASLNTVNVIGLDLRTITDLNHMFNQATISNIIGLNTLNYYYITNTSYMFNNCDIPVINLSGVTFSSLQDASYMFYVSDNTVNPKTVNLSNTSFPILTNAYYMFYSYNTSYREPHGLTLNTTNMSIESNGLNAGWMFAYIYATNNFNISFLENVKLTNVTGMFAYSTLPETDFSILDFYWASGSAAANSTSAFYQCDTPTIHIVSDMPYNVTSYYTFYLVYGNWAEDVIYELTFPSSISKLNQFITLDSYNKAQNYLIKNTTIYGGTFGDFVRITPDGTMNANIKFENTIMHIPNNANLGNFLYGNNYGVVDMRGLTIDGVCSLEGNGLMSYNGNCRLNTIYWPTTGIKFSGQVYKIVVGHTYWDSELQKSITTSPVVYNLDKFDVSRAYSLNSLFDNVNGDYSLDNWDTSNITRIYAITNNYFYGNLSLRNWDISNVTYLYGISYFYGGSVDFDGWTSSLDQIVDPSFQLISTSGGNVRGTIYLPNTLYRPAVASSIMCYCYTSDLIDVYTNATSIEDQNWTFTHIYTAEEPYGYRLHLGSTHEDFLTAIGGD